MTNLPEIQENLPLGPRTTLGVGGPARYFASVASEDELRSALAWASERRLPAFVLGGGSNLVVSDAGFDGLVVRMDVRGIEAAGVGDAIHVTAGAGEDWDGFVRHVVAQGWQGVECLAGIPGGVGGTPVQNVGAYGQEVADTIVRVCAFDRQTGKARDLPAAECGFAYRRSRFNTDEMGRWVILSVTYALRSGAPAAIKYADLVRHFADAAAAPPNLPAVYEAVREIRSRKGMVVRADDPDSRSAGSFFKNPTVNAITADRIAARFPDALMPQWPQPDGSMKLSAAWLIERAGFARGQALGNAGLSSKHVLALVNRGGASAAEIVGLARRVQAEVVETWGVTLSPEPVFLGFGPGDPLPANAVRAAVAGTDTLQVP